MVSPMVEDYCKADLNDWSWMRQDISGFPKMRQTMTGSNAALKGVPYLRKMGAYTSGSRGSKDDITSECIFGTSSVLLSLVYN